ncbi:hypothetical protein, partial [Streptococcus agalactiae]
RPIVITIVKEKTSWINIPVCLQSEEWYYLIPFFLCNKMAKIKIDRIFDSVYLVITENQKDYTNFFIDKQKH